MDLRPAFHRAFGRRNFAKNNEVYGDISWPARSPMFAFDFSLWVNFQRRVFLARSAELHALKLRISEIRNGVSPVTTA
jgi:hypothetical protein